MKKTKVLVLGNDPQINNIAFDKLDRSVITLGINRIWLKYIPHYFFFHDIEILRELNTNPEALAKLKQNSTCFSTDWLSIRSRVTKVNVPSWVKIYPRVDRYRFVDSVTHAIQGMSRNLLGQNNITYYVAGVALTWKEPSHFWKTLDHKALNTHDANWYTSRFSMMYSNFEYLKSLGFNIVSVHPDSKLNKLFRYEPVESLYHK